MEKVYVYIVYACDNWDWSIDKSVLSIHQSKEGAEKAKSDYERDYGGEQDWATVEKKEVRP